MTVGQVVAHLQSYPDDLEVRTLADFGTGVAEISLDNVVDSNEWDERDVPVVFLVEKESMTYEMTYATDG